MGQDVLVIPCLYRPMKVRGERECKECGTRWSYYETGSINCPACGSVHSVGVDERTRHTAGPRSLDLTPARNLHQEGQPLRRVAERAAELCGEFTRTHGFIHSGDLQPLSGTFLAAMELRHVADEVGRTMQLGDDEEYYFLELLREADGGDRPEPEEVPSSLRAARGLAYANAVRDYRDDLRQHLEDHPDSTVRSALESLGTHVKRVRALDGDVPLSEVELLVAAVRDLWMYVDGNEEAALARAEDRLALLRDEW